MRRTLSQALAGQLRRFANETKRFELLATCDGKARKVESWDDWSDLGDLAETIIDAAKDDGTDDSYSVVAIDENDEELGYTMSWCGETKALVVQPISTPVVAEYDAEPQQNVVKFMGRLMKHSEKQNHFAISREEAIAQENHRMRKHIMKLERSHLEALRMQEELVSQAEERELKRRQAREEMALAKDLINDIKPLVPVVVNSIIGRRMLNEEEQSTLGSLLGTLEDNQIATILAVLKPGQRVALQKVIESADREDTNGKRDN
jgi:hypothetical protein